MGSCSLSPKKSELGKINGQRKNFPEKNKGGMTSWGVGEVCSYQDCRTPDSDHANHHSTSYTGACNTCLMQIVESVIARVANPRIIFFELVFYILIIIPCLSVVIIKICSF